MDAALVEEHDCQTEEVSHEDYTVEYLGIDAKAIIYLLLIWVFPVRLTGDIRYIEEGQVLHNAENNPNADDAGALILEIRIITRMSNPKHEPDQDEKANPVDYIEANGIRLSKRLDSPRFGHVNERVAFVVYLIFKEATNAIGRLLDRKDRVYAGEQHGESTKDHRRKQEEDKAFQ